MNICAERVMEVATDEGEGERLIRNLYKNLNKICMIMDIMVT